MLLGVLGAQNILVLKNSFFLHALLSAIPMIIAHIKLNLTLQILHCVYGIVGKVVVCWYAFCTLLYSD